MEGLSKKSHSKINHEVFFWGGATSLHICELWCFANTVGVLGNGSCLLRGPCYRTVRDASPGPNYRPPHGGGTSF